MQLRTCQHADPLLPTCNRRLATEASAWALPVADCSGEGVEVRGTVAFEGRPISDGTIIFLPAAEPTRGRLVQARIVDGQFSVGSAQRLMPGNYRVAVRARRQVRRNDGMPAGRYEQYLPREYNCQTHLLVNLLDHTDGLCFDLGCPS